MDYMNDLEEQGQKEPSRRMLKILGLLAFIALFSVGLYFLDGISREVIIEGLPNLPALGGNQIISEKMTPVSIQNEGFPAVLSKSSILRWRNLRIAATAVSILTVAIIIALVAFFLYRKYWYTLEDMVIYAKTYPVKPREYVFYEQQTKDRPLAELRDFYTQFVVNDDNFDLADVSAAPPESVKSFKYATSMHFFEKIEYLSTDSYLELVKRISNKTGTVVVLLPYTQHESTLYFRSMAGANEDFFVVPVWSLIEENSKVAVKRLTGPF